MTAGWELVQRAISDASLMLWQEWLSTATQIASVWYAGRNNVLVYPTGMVGVLLAFWLYLFVASPPLYADAALNVYYFVMSAWGWYNWTRVKEDNQHAFAIRNANTSDQATGIALFLFAWIGISWVLTRFTDSNTPVLDAMVTASAVTAMWWMAIRILENWYMWTLSNLIAIPLNLYKGFILFTFMYILFLYMSIQGIREWRKKMAHDS